MQFLAIVNRFIVKTLLNSAFTNDLKRNENISKMFIIADLVSLTDVFAILWESDLFTFHNL